MRPFYSFPLKTSVITEKKRHPMGEPKGAIAEYLRLILKTHLTGYRYDYDFGCYVWDHDFENIQSVSKWENELENRIKATIEQYEKRIDKITTKIKVEEPEDFARQITLPNRLKRRINIIVSGTIHKTREPFQHQEFIYFSPLSIN